MADIVLLWTNQIANILYNNDNNNNDDDKYRHNNNSYRNTKNYLVSGKSHV